MCTLFTYLKTECSTRMFLHSHAQQESSGSIKAGKSFDKLSNYQFLKGPDQSSFVISKWRPPLTSPLHIKSYLESYIWVKGHSVSNIYFVILFQLSMPTGPGSNVQHLTSRGNVLSAGLFCVALSANIKKKKQLTFIKYSYNFMPKLIILT